MHGNTCANLAPSLCFARFPCVTLHNEIETSYKCISRDTPRLKFEYTTFERLSHIGSHFVQPGLLSCGQFFLGTFVVDSVRFINHIILDGLEGTHHVLARFAKWQASSWMRNSGLTFGKVIAAIMVSTLSLRDSFTICS